MAYYIHFSPPITRIAAVDLSTHQYKFVNLDSAAKLVLAGAGGKAIGVNEDKPLAGYPASVQIDGVAKVVAGAAVAAGVDVMSDASGRAVLAVVATTNQRLGRALAAAGAAGEIIPVLLEISATAV